MNVQKKIIIQNIKITILEDDSYINFNSKKRLLLIGGSLRLMKVFDNDDVKLISCFIDNYCYYIKKYFIQKYNYHVYNLPLSQDNGDLHYLDGLVEFDYVIDINQRGFYNKGIEFYNKLRPKIKYLTAAICDNNDHPNLYGPQDILLYAINNKKQVNDRSYYIGWATNPEIFYPKKSDVFLNILIDDNIGDHIKKNTEEIIKKCYEYMLDNDDVIVIRFGYGDDIFGLVDEYKHTNDRYIVIKDKLPQIIKSEYHNVSNIYLVTHSESLGLEVLESAMAGCFIVYKREFIKEELLHDIDHFTYDNIDEVDFDVIRKLINSDEHRKSVLKYSWERLCDRIYELFS